MFLLNTVINDDDVDDGNIQALKRQKSLQLTMVMYHKTVLKNSGDDKEYLFVGETVELYGYSFEELV
jgi:hypothetical protein